ncbi:hypothetical protein DelCs14_1800 [Delftia sp. Cs1-4]|uniref:hypothetical protein n=1 Tax=Delftia sp. (strain Cs1-4) TaxID=742013 RepID=UPI00020E7BEA|nr:hypothetical protein [Delftia sp. Cs1-4]AEF88825.1 hypothetical protein DelCs14_1800 [Delftia sp. Cs1-4]
MNTSLPNHLWLFADPTGRLPVAFRMREVMAAPAAAAQGAGQRPLDTPTRPAPAGAHEH